MYWVTEGVPHLLRSRCMLQTWFITLFEYYPPPGTHPPQPPAQHLPLFSRFTAVAAYTAAARSFIEATAGACFPSSARKPGKYPVRSARIHKTWRSTSLCWYVRKYSFFKNRPGSVSEKSYSPPGNKSSMTPDNQHSPCCKSRQSRSQSASTMRGHDSPTHQAVLAADISVAERIGFPSAAR